MEKQPQILENEIWFLDLIRDHHKAIILMSLDGTVLFLNGKAEAMTGLSIQVATGKNFMEVLCLEDKRNNACIPFSTVIDWLGKETKTYLDKDINIKDSSHRLIPVKGFIQAITDNQGNRLRLMAVFDERTDSDVFLPDMPGERYKWISELMSDAIVMVNEKAIIIYANRRLCQTLNYKLTEMIGQPLSSFMDERNWKIVVEQMNKRRQGIEDPYDIEMRTKEGKIKNGHVVPKALFNAKGEFRGTFAVIRDFTEKIEAEKTILLLRMAMEQANDGIAILDLHGKILFSNPSFCYMLGRDAKTDPLCNMDDLFQDSSPKTETPALLNRVRANGYAVEKITFMKKEEKITMLLSLTLVRNEEHAESQIICLLQDISEQEKTLRDLATKDSRLLLHILNDLTQVLSVTESLLEKEPDLEKKIKLSQIRGISRNLSDRVTRSLDELKDYPQTVPVNMKKMLEMMDENEEIAESFISSFLDVFPQLVRQVTAAMLKNDAKACIEGVHKMKGTVGYLGNFRLTAGVVDVLDALRAGDMDKARHLFRPIPGLTEEIIQFLKKRKTGAD
jgi:PAS domain S-box-containing protein